MGIYKDDLAMDVSVCHEILLKKKKTPQNLFSGRLFCKMMLQLLLKEFVPLCLRAATFGNERTNNPESTVRAPGTH